MRGGGSPLRLTRPLRAAAAERGLTDYVNLWSGQAAPLTRRRPAGEYVAALVAETAAALGGAPG
ncbi:hypothetical protein NLX86_21525 [Streptomyces sp. A3M-1-3]|uniref:hypothetical protein n=1 Tax=Streptomyces sp. A3M-1-3 TaxID=2962044 RepID=UPI0020B72399|nr:hypothetical protein [Streptomyces sp. A3M-1-3]MCP3820581.1 hypothetical protein [Streptomyces sp. A3M-1-3]